MAYSGYLAIVLYCTTMLDMFYPTPMVEQAPAATQYSG